MRLGLYVLSRPVLPLAGKREVRRPMGKPTDDNDFDWIPHLCVWGAPLLKLL